jgi:hypothetical protein
MFPARLLHFDFCILQFAFWFLYAAHLARTKPWWGCRTTLPAHGFPLFPESLIPGLAPAPPTRNFAHMVDQEIPTRWKRIFRFVDAHRPLLATPGAIVATWRTYQGHRLGPYYRLAYRENGRQQSRDLGCCKELVARVRGTLADFQRRLQESKVMRGLIHAAKRAWHLCELRLRVQLSAVGIQMQGWELRGVREAFDRAFLPPCCWEAEYKSLFPPPPPTLEIPTPESIPKWFSTWRDGPDRLLGLPSGAFINSLHLTSIA